MFNHPINNATNNPANIHVLHIYTTKVDHQKMKRYIPEIWYR